MRKLASIQKIAEIRPIEGADAIEHYRVNGWWIVDKVGAHKVGDLVAYCEVDSWIPHDLAPFLSKGREPRDYNGVKGERLRSIKLRGALSQGLILPKDTPLHLGKYTLLQRIDETISKYFYRKEDGEEVPYFFEEGYDLTEFLGIQKWEPPIPAQLSGKMKGNFPSWARKTDQERCQSIWPEIQKHIEDGTQFEVTMKLDGSSASYGLSPLGEYTVCSRNLSLLTDQEGNTFIDTGRKYNLEEKLLEYGRPLMISGELMGPGIQKNQEQLKDHQLFVFDVFDPTIGNYLSAEERYKVTEILGLVYVPVLHKSVTLSELGIDSIEKLLAFAEGPSMFAKQREGVVFKSVDGKFSFKAISNKWLLKNEG